MERLFALAIFLSAMLLFTLQPLAGKLLLPVLGGSPAIWSTCLVFFQAVLLLGYLYAHGVAAGLSRNFQRAAHIVLLIGASATLPFGVEIEPPRDGDPRVWLLRSLALSVGLPFFVLASTAPLLQEWFARAGARGERDPYFLYAISNAGSLVGLLAYPLLEPFVTRSEQTIGWSVGFWIAAVAIAGAAYISLGSSAAVRSPASGTREIGHGSTQEVTWSKRGSWIALAFVPSMLLLGVTQHIATDVVSAPLIWILPLALYLLTFVAAFARRPLGTARLWSTVAPIIVVVVLALSLGEVRYPIFALALAHLAAFFVLAMLCHTALAESRPHPSGLTDFYVWVSLGGVLGGAAVALVAPVMFSSVIEYPIAIALALLVRPATSNVKWLGRSGASRWVWYGAAVGCALAAWWGLWTVKQEIADENHRRLIALAFLGPALVFVVLPRAAPLFAGTVAGLLVSGNAVRTGGEVLYRERTFFGVHQVTSQQDGQWHLLTHGTTMHGVQATRGRLRPVPTAYYHPTGPLGDLVFTLSADGRFRDIGAVGLGAGALAAYAGSGTRMDFFEIDDAIIRIAENSDYFTYLTDARLRQGAVVRAFAMDGRLGIAAAPAASYDVIVLDAFSSDAIPTHLITREAIAMYESRLRPRGVLAFHVSSRFFDLAPVLAGVAADRRLVAYVREDLEVPPERAAEARRPSVWVVLARDERDLGQLADPTSQWKRLLADPGDRVWTDDYSNVLKVLQ